MSERGYYCWDTNEQKVMHVKAGTPDRAAEAFAFDTRVGAGFAIRVVDVEHVLSYGVHPRRYQSEAE